MNKLKTGKDGLTQAERMSKNMKTHGHTVGKSSPTYVVWSNMRQRCNDKNSKSYAIYGGRGITICERWNEFSNFLADMGERPESMSIDRIDNSKGYSPDNCKWATFGEQCRNRRSNVYLTYEGRTLTSSDWAAELGVNPSSLNQRLKRGWSTKRALTEPYHLGKSTRRLSKRSEEEK